MDGWDATVKVCAVVNVLMDYPLKPTDVQREGIRHLTPQAIRGARVTLAPALAAQSQVQV